MQSKKNRKEERLLCILHLSPPAHGAAKVGDFIKSSRIINESFNCKFIKINSSDTISDIGKVSFKKIWLVLELYMKVFWALFVFRPSIIYYTASIGSVAFFRDVMISTLWKTYGLFFTCKVFYHYHTKGINAVVSSSSTILRLTRYFLKNVRLILLSPLLVDDYHKVQTYYSIHYLPNGVADHGGELQKRNYSSRIECLFLAHMMKEKGYQEALQLALYVKDQNICFHFAGAWKEESDRAWFETFVKENELQNKVFYHGFVSGDEKEVLFQKTHFLLYPSKNDAFPLTILESFSYGVPVLATNEGSIPYIVDEKSGVIIDNINDLFPALQKMYDLLLNEETSVYCRKRYEEKFSLNQFEKNFIKVLHEQ